jgi:hypothetical protein
MKNFVLKFNNHESKEEILKRINEVLVQAYDK